MKAENIVKALIAKLPELTDKFCSQLAIDSITQAGLVATATIAAGHGRVDNELVTITGAISPISIVSITRSGTTAVVVTATNHDFTFSAREIAKGLEQDVILSGSTEAEFNGTFSLLSVANRKTFSIEVVDSGPLTATGAPTLENGSSAFGGYNGAFNITVLNATQFTYPLQVAIPNNATGAPIMHNGHRVSAAISIERFLEAYTKQTTDQWWCVAVLGDVIASKGRENRSDSTDQQGDYHHYQQSITQPFGIYLVAPSSNSIAGRTQRDDAEDLVPFIMQSVLLTKFPTGFAANEENRSTFTAHGFFMYNGPVYVHEVTFEQNANLLFVDSVGNDLDVAFRDIDLTIGTDLGTTVLTASVDFDEEPLP
jgi:hypothetical protein